MRFLSLFALMLTVAMIGQPAVGAQTDGVPETGFFAQSAGANAGPATQAVPQGSPSNPPVDPIRLTQEPYSLRWKWKDSAIISAGALILASSVLPKVHPSCPCVPADLNRLDRRFAGHQSVAADRASTVLIAVIYAAPVIDSAVHRFRLGPQEIIVAESALLNQGIVSLTKNLAGRPRPFIYGVMDRTRSDLWDKETYKSFYSWHASNAFAVSLAYAKGFRSRHPDVPRGLVYGIAVSISAAAAALRMPAGKHFPTDVMTGAAIGTAIGIGMPAAHR